MGDSLLFHEGNRRLQDQFESRRIADKLESFARTAFSEDDKSFIENALYFFLAAADAQGRSDCSFKGGVTEFLRVTGACELVFPDDDPPEPAWKSFPEFKDCVHPRQPAATGGS